MNFSRFAVAALITLGACGSDTTKPSGPVAGIWAGAGFAAGANFNFVMTLSQAGTSVSGTGKSANSVGTNTFTVVGTFADPNIDLSLSSNGAVTATFDGTVLGRSMVGTLSSGDIRTTLSLTRQ
jgi:hypothetical protein